MENESTTTAGPPPPQPFITQSPEINELAGALSLAQGDMDPAKKGASNPFFKSKYADLTEVIEASRYPLTANDLSIVQYCDDGYVVTQLMHSSGQWIRGRLRLQPKDGTPQGIGSALTYARRYSWQMMVGLGAEDDDGEAAMGRSAYDPEIAKPPARKKATPKKKPAEPKKKVEEPKKEEPKKGYHRKGEPKTETAGEDRHEPKTETSTEPVEEKDDAATIIAAIPRAADYLAALDIPLDDVPTSVQERIVEKGVDGFGELVAQWVLKKESEA